MEFNVINHQLCVGDIKIIGVASSALFLIGDVQTVQLTSAFDTPPESLIIGPVVPFAPKG
ncbi:spore gernimation protein GerPD [Peribacillus simplex]|uniref:spore gernimation protein GerPD n=1 Tax=Peribacillus simplex TaxID=1478 RepID=UPI000F630E68|nr:spore gernimation protein GerPD [Peribacillus simplex]RRN72573.1 spore gernimation protein GerPD [Peribacillus simplex]